MILNDSVEYLTVTVNEGEKEINGEWVRTVIVRFPKEEFSIETVNEIVNSAVSVANFSKGKTARYSLSNIIEIIEKDYYTDVWFENSEIIIGEAYSEDAIQNAINEGVNSI